MKQIDIKIKGTIEVPDEATYEEIEKAVKFSVGLGCEIELDNPIGDEIEWVDGDVEIRL